MPLSLSEKIIESINRLGYPQMDQDGSCSGIIQQWMQACFVNTEFGANTGEARFFELLRIIDEEPDFWAEVENTRKKIKEKEVLKPIDDLYLEASALLDNIYLSHLPDTQKELFGTYVSQADSGLLSEYTASTLLEKKFKESDVKQISRISIHLL